MQTVSTSFRKRNQTLKLAISFQSFEPKHLNQIQVTFGTPHITKCVLSERRKI